MSSLKTCTFCLQSKPKEDFVFRLQRGVRVPTETCVECISEKRKCYYRNNKERISRWLSENKHKYKEKRNLSIKAWKERNLEKVRAYARKGSAKNRKKFPEKQKQALAKWRKANASHIREYSKKYKKDHMDKTVASECRRVRRKKQSDPLFRLKLTLRSRFTPFKSKTRKSVISILGCSMEHFRDHIQSQFKEGMNWNNHGKTTWHIDHIKPLASCVTENEMIECFHYTNMQPLWAHENMAKGSKIL